MFPLSTLSNLFQMAQVPLFQGRQKRGTSCRDYPSREPDQQWSVCVHHKGKRNQGSCLEGVIYIRLDSGLRRWEGGLQT